MDAIFVEVIANNEYQVLLCGQLSVYNDTVFPENSVVRQPHLQRIDRIFVDGNNSRIERRSTGFPPEHGCRAITSPGIS